MKLLSHSTYIIAEIPLMVAIVKQLNLSRRRRRLVMFASFSHSSSRRPRLSPMTTTKESGTFKTHTTLLRGNPPAQGSQLRLRLRL